MTTTMAKLEAKSVVEKEKIVLTNEKCEISIYKNKEKLRIEKVIIKWDIDEKHKFYQKRIQFEPLTGTLITNLSFRSSIIMHNHFHIMNPDLDICCFLYYNKIKISFGKFEDFVEFEI